MKTTITTILAALAISTAAHAERPSWKGTRGTITLNSYVVDGNLSASTMPGPETVLQLYITCADPDVNEFKITMKYSVNGATSTSVLYWRASETGFPTIASYPGIIPEYVESLSITPIQDKATVTYPLTQYVPLSNFAGSASIAYWEDINLSAKEIPPSNPTPGKPWLGAVMELFILDRDTTVTEYRVFQSHNEGNVSYSSSLYWAGDENRVATATYQNTLPDNVTALSITPLKLLGTETFINGAASAMEMHPAFAKSNCGELARVGGQNPFCNLPMR